MTHIRLTALSWFLLLVMTMALPYDGWSQAPTYLKRFTYSHPQMGTLFNLALFAPDSSQAGQAARAAFGRIDALNDQMSDYLESSDLSMISATAGSGKPTMLGEDLWAVLYAAQEISLASNGSFDVTIGPLSKLWRKAIRQKEYPSSDELKAAKALVGFRNMELDTVTHMALLKKKGMQLDLGAIAKGYALDEAMVIIRKMGITVALLQGGGDLIAGDAPPGQDGWQVLTKKINTAGQVRDTILLFKNCAVATSGALFRFLEWEGKRYSHVIDPVKGIGVTHGAMVSVQGPNAMMTDALASTINVMGPKKGIEWLRKKYPGYEAQATYQEKGKNKLLGGLKPVH